MKANINGNEVTYNGKSIMLSLAHIKVLTELQDKFPLVVTEVDLMKLTNTMSRHTLTQRISTLRKKLKVFEDFTIITHPKIGYALKIKGE